MRRILFLSVLLTIIYFPAMGIVEHSAEDISTSEGEYLRESYVGEYTEIAARSEVVTKDEVGRVTSAPTPEVVKKATNTITLELKNMDVVEVIKLLSSKGNFDVVVSQNVRGRVTLFLDEVPIWDALQIVFQTVGLAYVEHEGILRVITDREFEQQYGKKFHDNREVVIIPLEYTTADNVVRELKALKSRLGNIISDDRTNSVILLDTPASIKVMEAAIKQLDIPIETKVYELTYTPAKSLEEMIKTIVSKSGTLYVDDLTNKIILTDIPEAIRQANLIIEEYDKPQYLQTKVFALNYAQYDKVEEKIKDVLTPDIGFIKSDERTNKVVVTDLPEKISEVEMLIHEYDAPTKQVLIISKIVEVTLNDEFNMGINWQSILNQVLVSKFFGTDTISMTLSSVFETLSEIGVSDTEPFDNPVRVQNPGGRTLITGTLSDGTDFDAIINALKTNGETNLLSSPRILAVNNEEARIQVGKREAFVTNTVVQSDTAATTAENVTFVDVGIMLTVTPTISNDGFIIMKIKPEVSNVAEKLTTAEGNEIPIVQTQEAETTVKVKDGATIIMGGLILDGQTKTTSKIPIIGSIPLLGIPFRKEYNKIAKDELVIFLTPNIVSGDIDLTTPSPKLMNYLAGIEETIEGAGNAEEVVVPIESIMPVDEDSVKKEERKKKIGHR